MSEAKIATHVKGDENPLGVVSIQTLSYDGKLVDPDAKGSYDELARVVVDGDADAHEVAEALSGAFATISERYAELAKSFREEAGVEDE